MRDIHPSVTIGQHTKIHNLCFIEGNVEIGDFCTIKPLVFLCSGTKIGDYVFIGPGTVFCNDRLPKSQNPSWILNAPVIEDFVSIGANCTILPGVKIQKNTLIGAGSVVAKDISSNSIAFGNPARVRRKHGTI